MDDSVTIKAECLCKAHTFSASISKSTLPLRASCCHCTSCRHITGALYSACVKWPDPSEDLSNLKRYALSEKTNVYSCGTCSSQLFCSGISTNEAPWVVTGALENMPDLVKYKTHMFVGDTIDGGASIWLPRDDNGEPIKRWREAANGSEELPLDWPTVKASTAAPVSGRDTSASHVAPKAGPSVTHFHCHCKGVQLSLRSAIDLESHPAQEVSWCIDRATMKYKAKSDACNSCRITFGIDIPGWTYAPLSQIQFDSDSTSEPSNFPQTLSALREATISKDKDPRLGTLDLYKSSPDVDRYFCARCSANVFYAVDDREGMVDIAVGLLDHPDGARAEGLLSWSYGQVGWEDDASGGWREQLVKTVKALGKEWAVSSEN